MADMGNFHLAQRNSVVPFKFLWEITHWDKRFNGVDNHKQVEIRRYSYLLASELKTLAAPGGNIKLLNTGAGDFGFTTAELAGNNLADGEIISVPWGGTPSVQYHKGPFVTADNRIAVSRDTEVIRTRFLYFALLAQMPQITKLYRGSGIKHPDMNKLLDLRIPIPPIEIQDSIVRILDKMSDLQDELQAELEARKEQYEHYRASLLDPKSGEVKRVPLRELCNVFNGYAFKSELFNTDDRGLPLIRIRDVNSGISGTYYSGFYEDKYRVQQGDLLIGMDGDFNAIRWPHGPALLNQRVCRLQEFSNETIPGYVFHWVRGAVKEIQKSTSASTVKHLSSGQIGDIMIPVPDIDYQRNVVDLLDKLDALTKGAQHSLPAEIAARKRQYEHYRDQLLAFTEA